jgi:hypothetical protein
VSLTFHLYTNEIKKRKGLTVEKRTRGGLSGGGMQSRRLGDSVSGVVSRSVLSEITCCIACDLFHDGLLIPIFLYGHHHQQQRLKRQETQKP